MGIFRKLALLGAFALLLPNAVALAADMPEAPAYVPPQSGPVEFGSGWYLRGDLGYKLYKAPDAHFDVVGYGDMIGESLDNTVGAGVGFGYRFNPWFRTDVTLDYEWPAQFHGRLNCPNSPCVSGTDFSDEYAKISAWTSLVNVYFDLGNFRGWSPYVGAGIGVADLTTSSVHYVNPDSSTGSWGGASKWNLAWALMAGVSYNLTQQWVLDANYRYLHLGDAVSGPTTFGGEPIHYDNISASEFRIGLRYLIN